MDYERLDLANPQSTQRWAMNAHEYWRRAERDRFRGLDAEIQATLDDIVRYCTAYPKDATLHQVIPESLIHYTSGRMDALLPICHALSAIVCTGAAPTHIGMLSNWVKLVDYATAPEKGVQCAWVLRGAVEGLTQSSGVHPWDSALVFMAAQTAFDYGTENEREALALVAATDTNAHRLATRLMTVMEHTRSGPLWWRTINALHGGDAEAPLPEMPVAREVVSRPERSYQAWWRYGGQMEKTTQFSWVHAWVESLVSPARDVSFSTNGLL